MSVEKYKKLILKLFPTGKAWKKVGEGDLINFSYGLAEELNRVELRGKDIFNEADPRGTTELLTDWERVTGLPDSCSGLAETIGKRRDAIVTKLTAIGGQSIKYYIDLADNLGYTITITEYRPFLAGRGRAGDRITNNEWIFVFTVNSSLATITGFKAGVARAGDRLRFWSNAELECLINKFKPANTLALFSYT